MAPERRPSTSTTTTQGQGWTQLTEYGKIFLSKKEKNVFILEGTKAAGYSACSYRGNAEEQSLSESGHFSITSELKWAPGDHLTEGQILVLLDCASVADLSSGCDFSAVLLRFDTRELRVENHRRNAATQTLFSQPNCSLLRPNSYVSVTVVMQQEAFSLELNGITLVSYLPLGRVRPKGTSGCVGLAVYGRTRCMLRRYSIRTSAAAKSGARVTTALTEEMPRTEASTRAQPPIGGGLNVAVEDMELAAAVERDVVVADLKVRFEDIGGLEDAKRAINEALVLPLLLPDLFTGLRRPWKGVLLFGPPGTGKTLLAKAVASCTENITFINCSSATLTSKWRGDSEKLLRALFATARARAPSILFFDEIDSLLSQRGGLAEHEASRRFKSEFLIHMDGLLSDAQHQDSGHLLVLATTNAPWDLDEALRRRLEKRIYIPLPDQSARFCVLQHHLKDIALEEGVDLHELAARMEGFSGADVQLVCREAAMNPMRRAVAGFSPAELVQLRDEGKLSGESMRVEAADLEAAVRSVQPSVSACDTQRFKDWAQEFGSR